MVRLGGRGAAARVAAMLCARGVGALSVRWRCVPDGDPSAAEASEGGPDGPVHLAGGEAVVRRAAWLSISTVMLCCVGHSCRSAPRAGCPRARALVPGCPRARALVPGGLHRGRAQGVLERAHSSLVNAARAAPSPTPRTAHTAHSRCRLPPRYTTARDTRLTPLTVTQIFPG